jgi:short-subunit dehydrogenase
MELGGRRILLTGATRGIGRALAERFAAEGARLALIARSPGPLRELAAALGAQAFPVDLADEGAVRGLVGRIEADGGPIDVLVNNAGVSNIGYVLDQKPEDVERLFRTNLLTPIHLCQQAIPRMLARGGGHVVNVASIAAVLTPPGLVHYGASKAGLAHYTAGLRMDLRDLPIGVTLVQIGSTATEMDDATQAYPPYVALRRGRPVEQVRFPIGQVVDGIVDAIRRERPNVVLPKPLWAVAGMVEAPRALARFLFRRVSPRP